MLIDVVRHMALVEEEVAGAGGAVSATQAPKEGGGDAPGDLPQKAREALAPKNAALLQSAYRKIREAEGVAQNLSAAEMKVAAAAFVRIAKALPPVALAKLVLKIAGGFPQ